MDRKLLYEIYIILYSPNEHSIRSSKMKKKKQNKRKRIQSLHFAIEGEQIKTNDTNQIKTEKQ